MTDLDHIYRHFIAGKMIPFYTAFYSRLILYATRILGPRLAYMAEDCVQTAVLNTYLHRAGLHDAQKWKAWLLTAVRNNALMQLRGDELRRRYEEYGMLSKDEAEDIHLASIEQDVYTRLYDVLAQLPEKYREIFNLSFEQGLKVAEVAEKLGIAEITVKKRKARLIELLRERLGGDIDEATLMLILLALSC